MSRFLVSPEGVLEEVPEENAVEAVANGYRAETPAEQKRREAGDSPGRAALEGAARGVTMGLSDPFLKGYTGDPEGLRMRKEENPLAAGGGEVAGVVGGALLSKKVPTPVGLVSRGADVVRRAEGSAFATRAAPGAFEGSMFGLSQAITENALEDKPLTGEKILASAGGGALTGAGINVAFGAVGDLGGKLLEKALGGKALQEQLKETADQVFMRQFFTGKSDLKKYGRAERIEEFADFARKKGWLEAGATVEKVGEAAEKHIDEVLSPVFDRQFVKLGQNQAFADAQPIVDRIRKEVIDPLANDPTTAARAAQMENWVTTLEGQVATAGMGGTPFTFQKLWDVQKNMRLKVGPQDPNFSFKQDLWRARGVVLDEMMGQLEKQAPVQAKILEKAAHEYGMAINFAEMVEKKLEQKLGNNAIGLRDTIVGAGALGAAGSMGGPVGAMLGGAAGAVGTKLARERGPFLLAAAADSLRKSKFMDNMGKGLKGLLDEKFATLGPLATGVRSQLEKAGAEGMGNLIEKHIELSQTDPNYMPGFGFNHEDPDTMNAAVQRGIAITQMQEAAEAYDKRVDQAVGRFLGTQPGRAPAPKAQNLEEFQDRVIELEKMVNDTGYLQRKLPDLMQQAPGVGVSMFETAQRASEFLYKKAPKPDAVLMPALQRPFLPPDGEIEKWFRYVAAVEDPLSVIESMREGGVSPEAAEALQFVYPKLYEDFRKKTMDRLADLKDPMDYEKKLALQTLFGEDIGGVPGELQLLQTMHATQYETQGGGTKPDGRQVVDQAANMETQGQRLEKRGQK